ncbi:MAG: hypothetical protein ACI9UJ_000018 [bacterium]|jgi:hypothetical protein
MKKLAIFIVIISSTLSCTEVPPFIDLSEPILLARDTTYISSDVPQQVLKNVLIEDISGVACNNCPKAADIAHEIQAANPNRVVVMTLHSNKYGVFTRPFADSKDTFNTVEATEIVSNLIGEPSGLPAGAIDRKLFDGETSKINQNYETWGTQVDLQLALNAKVKLELEVIKQQDRKVIANVKATFTEQDETPVYLSIFIIESKINSKQKLPDNTYDKDFEHNSILRKGVTNYAGLLLAESVEVGRVFEKGVKIDIPAKYNIDNCAIVVLINKNSGNNTEVIQCAEQHIE